MPVDYEPELVRLIGEGRAARSLLLAMDTFCAVLVEETLKALDRSVTNGELTAERAIAYCHELAAYRRIVLRLRGRVVAGERAAERQAAQHSQEGDAA